MAELTQIAASLSSEVAVEADLAVAAPKQRRQRARRRDVTENRTAIAAIKSTHSKLGKWQSQCAYLFTLAVRRPEVTKGRIDALRIEIENEMQVLDTALQSLPERIRGNGHCVDVRRALHGMYGRLGEAELGINTATRK